MDEPLNPDMVDVFIACPACGDKYVEEWGGELELAPDTIAVKCPNCGLSGSYRIEFVEDAS